MGCTSTLSPSLRHNGSGPTPYTTAAHAKLKVYWLQTLRFSDWFTD